MTPPTQPTRPPAAVAGGEDGVEAEAGHQDCQQGEAQPPLAQVAVRVITGTDVVVCKTYVRALASQLIRLVTCKVLVLVMAMIQKTFCTRQTRHTLNALHR